MKRIIAATIMVLILAACAFVPGNYAIAEELCTVSLDDQSVFNKNNITITANELRYADGGEIELDLTISYTGKGIRIVYLPEMYVNDWKVQFAGDQSFIAISGVPQKVTIVVDNHDTALFDMMQIHEVEKVKFAVWTHNESYSILTQGFSNEIKNPLISADFIQSYDTSGEVLWDDSTIRIVQKAYDPASYSATLLIEKKQSSKWTRMTLDALYNGCRALRSEMLLMDKGVRALVTFDGKEDCESFGIAKLAQMDVYALYYHSDRLQKPFMVTMRENGVASSGEKHMLAFSGEPVYEDEYCELYYAGAVSGYYSDSDVIVFYCRNKTEKKVLALFTAYEYVLLDGERVAASQSNVNVYPESVSQVVLVTQGVDHNDLSDYRELVTTLGIYEIAGGYHKQLHTTGKLTLPLHGIKDPLRAAQTQNGVEN